MFRSAVLTTVTAVLLSISAAPAFAGPTETAFLQKLSANWVGKGKLTGAQTGAIACRIVITAGGKSAKFQGRCNIPDMAAQAFNGAISYNDAKKQYETRSVGGTVVGQKRGNSLVFTTTDRTMAGTSYSTMTISPSSLAVDFALVDKNGEKTTSHITFAK